MSKVLIIGAGGVGTVVAHKVAQNTDVFTEIMLASRTKSKCDRIAEDILKRYNLPITALTTHHNVVGWKDCPKLWTEKPALFEAFCYSVAEKKQRG